jgi:mannose-6-phosphate isomerase
MVNGKAARIIIKNMESGKRPGPADLKHHLLAELVPLWHAHGVDRERGGFFDSLDPALRPDERDRKSLLVTARQVYVFSHAYLLGGPEWMLDDARHGFKFLREAFWDPRRGGWFSSVTASGEPLNRRKAAYDHAFVLFAAAYFRRATNEKEALDVAEDTVGVLADKLADPVAGGFFEGADEEWSPETRVRRQNPHMHLFEAFLAMHEATGEARYLDHANRIAALFFDHFFDREHGCLLEYFARNWERDSSRMGRIVEPGHNYEWVWLLHQYARIAKRDDVLGYAAELFDFASTNGIDPGDGAAFDQVSREGEVLVSKKQVWPQTEHVKACAARYENYGTDLEAMTRTLALCFSRHVDPVHHGWLDYFTKEGKLLEPVIPAVTVYHIFLGLSEAIRVTEKKA